MLFCLDALSENDALSKYGAKATVKVLLKKHNGI